MGKGETGRGEGTSCHCGVTMRLPSASTIVTLSTSNGLAAYSANMAVRVSRTMRALVRSVAVASMKMLRVARVILVRSELMRGGTEHTPAASTTTGQRG